MIDRLTAVFFVAGVCFAAILPLEFRSDVAKPDPQPLLVAKSTETPAPRNEEPALKQFVTITLARPLFSATRRPPEAKPDGQTDASLNDLRLTGILIMPEQHFAIFAMHDGKPLVRSEGEMISDWRIDTIAAQSISLSGPTGTTTLEPKADPNLARVQLTSHPIAPTPQPATSSPPSPAPNAPVRPAPVLRPER
jgi:hypothetical protein